MQVLWVGLGGFVGSACRFLLSSFVQRLVPSAVFPFGTLVVNVLGCLLIGFPKCPNTRSHFRDRTYVAVLRRHNGRMKPDTFPVLSENCADLAWGW